MTNCVPFVIDAIVAPFGIPGPFTAIPGTNPAVLVTVTVVLAFVVDNPPKVPELPPSTFDNVAVPPPPCVTNTVPPVTSNPPRIELVVR
jgi:hypothetical protein